MQTIAYLQFNGNATEAFNFYEESLQATTVKKRKFGDLGDITGAAMTAEEKEMIMEASLEFSENKIRISDIPSFMKKTMGNKCRKFTHY